MTCPFCTHTLHTISSGNFECPNRACVVWLHPFTAKQLDGIREHIAQVAQKARVQP